MRIAIDNRRKQLAQCIWLRQRVEEHLALGDNVIVMGDFNDGPGLDEYEKLFGQSGVEIVIGVSKPESETLREPHAEAAMSARAGGFPTTSRFYLHNSKTYLNALLDYIMVTPHFRDRGARWRIWHPLDDPDCWENAALRDALVTASDHFPVTVDFDD